MAYSNSRFVPVILSEGARPSRRTPARPKPHASVAPLLPDRLIRKRHFASPALGQVFPARVHPLDEGDFLLPSPPFQLLLPADGFQNVVEFLVIHQPVAFVLAGETLKLTALVLRSEERRV